MEFAEEQGGNAAHMDEQFLTSQSVLFTSSPPKLVYTCRENKLEKNVLETFVQLNRDAETLEYLETYCSGKESFLQSTMAHVANYFLSRTDSNALVGRGQMFVLSTAQIERLLSHGKPGNKGGPTAVLPGGKPFQRLLDIGAGDGTVTKHFSPLVKHITVTEVSTHMIKRLEGLPFVDRACNTASLDPFPTGNESDHFDLIGLLNVLDRCHEPSTLLYEIRNRLVPSTGRLVLAVVLPFCPFVEDGTKQQTPSQDLNMNGGRCKEGASFEESVNVLINNVLIPHGFIVHSWSRLPYICAGDERQQYYVLSDAVFVLSHDGELGEEREDELMGLE